MLEMCLAMLCDLDPPPGVFVKCGDDIIIFDSNLVDLSREGFTALAHRSPVEVAYTHGVFVLDPASGACRRFTHKPPHERMARLGALLPPSHLEAYTDSCFFVSAAPCAALLAWFRADGAAVRCEIDAYGDVLQALGPDADDAYIPRAAPGDAAAAELERCRRALFALLRGAPLHVARLDRSRFWHIGTVPELLDHFSHVTSFLTEAGGAPPAPGAGAGGEGAYRFARGPQGLGFYTRDPSAAASACLLSCAADSSATFGRRTVAEYVRAGPGAAVGGGCLLSCAELGPGAAVPPGTLLVSVFLRAAGGGGGEEEGGGS